MRVAATKAPTAIGSSFLYGCFCRLKERKEPTMSVGGDTTEVRTPVLRMKTSGPSPLDDGAIEKLSLNPLNKLSFLFYYIYIISYILIFVKLYTFQFLLIECPKAIIVRNLTQNVRDLMRIVELFIKFQRSQTHARFYAIF